MADGAVGQLFGGQDLVILDQLRAQLGLRIRHAILIHHLGRLPIQVVHLVFRTDVFFRMAMAIETPAHGHRVNLGRERHFVHAAMTSHAGNALVHVDRVVEIHEVRHVVHTLPGNRLAAFEGIEDRLDLRRIRPDLRVAGHTGFGRRHIGEAAFVYRSVAVATIDAIVADVMLVRKLDRLLDGNVHQVAIRQIDAHQGYAQPGHAQHNTKNDQLGDSI